MSQHIAMLSGCADGDTEDEALVLGQGSSVSRLGAAPWAARAARAGIAIAVALTVAVLAAVAVTTWNGAEPAQPGSSSPSGGPFLPSNVLDEADGVISLQGGQCGGFPPEPACIIDTSANDFFEAAQADGSTMFCYKIKWESTADLSHIQWEFDPCVCDQFGGGVNEWVVLNPGGDDVSSNFQPEINFKQGCNFKLNTIGDFVNPGETFEYCYSIPSRDVCVCEVTLMVSKDGHCGDRECPDVYGPCCSCDTTPNPATTTEPFTTPDTGGRTLSTTDAPPPTVTATTITATTTTITATTTTATTTTATTTTVTTTTAATTTTATTVAGATTSATTTTAAAATTAAESTTPPVGGATGTTAPLTSSVSAVFTTTEECPLVPHPNPGECDIPCDLDRFNDLYQLREVMGGRECITGDTLGSLLASRSLKLPRSVDTCDSVWAGIENGPTESNPDVPVECKNKQEMLYHLCSPMCKFCEKCICA